MQRKIFGMFAFPFLHLISLFAAACVYLRSELVAGGIDSFASRTQDYVPMLRIAHLRFASSNLFARSLRSLGVLRPLLCSQKKTA